MLDAIRNGVRRVMRVVARGLNTISGGKLTPNMVTITGLLAHLPIAYLIGYGKLELAAILVVVFGLFDTLDGELARLQNRTSSVGMFLDSVTDRMKEIFLYGGIVYFLVAENMGMYVVWATLALGGSVLTSYVNAWGEVALAHSKIVHDKVNKAFRGGILRFEIRMFLLIIALFANRLPLFVVFIAIFAWVTAMQRILVITQKLGKADV